MENLKPFFTWLLSKLQGKKTSIGVILSAILVFCLGRGYIAKDTADLLAVILTVLGVGANIGTAKLLYQKDSK